MAKRKSARKTARKAKARTKVRAKARVKARPRKTARRAKRKSAPAPRAKTNPISTVIGAAEDAAMLRQRLAGPNTFED